MTMRYNMATGQMEDDGVPEDASLVANTSKATFDTVKSSLGRGEYAASGAATNGQVLTNSPTAKAALTAKPDAAQQALAAVQAKAAQAQADQIDYEQRGGPSPDAVQKVQKDLEPLRTAPQAKGQAVSFPKQAPVQKMTPELAAGQIQRAVVHNQGELPDMSTAESQQALKMLQQRNMGSVVTKLSEMQKNASAALESLKKREVFTDRESYLTAVDKLNVPTALKSWVVKQASEKPPASVLMFEESVNQDKAKAAGMAATFEQRKKDFLGMKTAEREASMAAFEANTVQAKKYNAEEAGFFAASSPRFSEIIDQQERATAQNEITKWMETGDTTGLSPARIKLFQDIKADFEAERQKIAVGDSQGIKWENVPPDVVNSRKMLRKAELSGVNIFEDKTGSGDLGRTLNEKSSNPDVEQNVKAIEDKYLAAAEHIGMERSDAHILALTNIDKDSVLKFADQSIGVSPGKSIRPGVGIKGDALDQDTKKITEILRARLGLGESLSSPGLQMEIAGVTASEKDEDQRRLRTSLAMTAAISAIRNDSSSKFKQLNEQKRAQLGSLFAEEMYNDISKLANATSSLDRYNVMSEFVRKGLVGMSTGDLGIEAPKTIAELGNIANRPDIFAKLALSRTISKLPTNDPDVPIYKQMLEDAVNQDTWPKFAAQNPALARSFELSARSWASAQSVVETQMRDALDTKLGAGATESFLGQGAVMDVAKSGDPKSAIIYTAPRFQQAVQNAPEKFKEYIRTQMAGNIQGVYGTGLKNDQLGQPVGSAEALVATLNNDSTWDARNGFYSTEEGGGNWKKAESDALSAAMIPIETKNKEVKYAPSELPAKIILSNPENAARISEKPKMMWRTGLDLSQNSSDPSERDFGQKLMRASLKMAHLEEKASLSRSVDQILKPLSTMASELVVYPGLGTIKSGFTGDAETIFKAMDTVKLDERSALWLDYAADQARKLKDAANALSKNNDMAKDPDTTSSLPKMIKAADMIIAANRKRQVESLFPSWDEPTEEVKKMFTTKDGSVDWLAMSSTGYLK